jgi:hypothetical protein
MSPRYIRKWYLTWFYSTRFRLIGIVTEMNRNERIFVIFPPDIGSPEMTVIEREQKIKVMDDFKYVNLDAITVAGDGRKIGLGAFSLLTAFYCAEPCTAALLHVMGAVSAARFASSTLFIVSIAVVSLGWTLWRLYRMRRACTDNKCPSSRAVWLTTLLVVAAFFVDVGL